MPPSNQPHILNRRAFLAGLALSSFGVMHPSRDVACRQASPTPKTDVFRYMVGDLDVLNFNTDRQPLSAVLGAANATAEEQAAITESDGPFTMDNAVTLVQSDSDVVLIDCGNSSFLTKKLEREGYAPEDIHLVVFSHLHGDHVAGAFDVLGRPLFPNARYLVSRAEHDFWMSDDDEGISSYAEPFVPSFRSDARIIIEAMGTQLELAEWDEEILPGVRMIPAIGHTGGHSAIEITSGQATLLHVGDLIVNPMMHLEHPDWYIAAAVWPDEDLASRRTLMDRAADEHLLVQTVHFPFPGVGYVEHDGDAWAWLPL